MCCRSCFSWRPDHSTDSDYHKEIADKIFSPYETEDTRLWKSRLWECYGGMRYGVTRCARNIAAASGGPPRPRSRGDACDCAGRVRTGWSYRREGLIQRFSTNAALPDVLMALASCERRADFSRPCGARFTDLAAPLARPPLPEP
jgi:hypothetical protein